MTRTLEGNILTSQGWLRGALDIDGARIAAIRGDAIDEATARSNGGALLLPGFIDLHVHGGDGRDIMEGGDAARTVARCHARHGSTALLATTMTAPMADLRVAFEGLNTVRSAPDSHAAHILGVHLEGPYINPGKLGAQPDFARRVSQEELAELNAMVPVRLLTIAPEMHGHLEQIPQLVAAGYRVQIGHTTGSYDDGVRALQRGATGFTHLFNAMTGLQHREPGMVGAALAHAQFAEIIPDLLHVHPGAIRAAMRAIPCLYCVTDSTSATGMPDGEYKLGRQPVTKCLGGVRLADGTLAGSALTMDKALRNLVERIGTSIEDASRRLSTYAADHLGLADRGRLEVGAHADIVVLDAALTLTDVIIEGRRNDA
ncbi:N-acetylglucosamine-6-phosphate deacetylase [Ramlibacter sp.]|uniref:N-acetylglucosamine-6-phosphate deacetylase n=1 Tax=Ramlibacter sp. TaxID=1917967 RepID=UPI003D0E31F4